jgi:O-antigen/teichoic acid export membrane protein
LSDFGRRALLGSLTTAAGSFGGFAGRFIINAIIARHLTPVDFGQFTLAMVSAEFLGILGAFSFPQTLLQLDDDHEHVVGTVLWMSVGLAVALLVVALGVWPFVTDAYGPVVGGCFLAMAGSRLTVGIGDTLVAAQQRRYAYHSAALVQLVGVIAAALGALSIALVAPSPWALVVRDVGPQVIVTFALGAWLLRHEGRALFVFNRRAAREVWGLSKALFLNRALEIAYLRVDSLVVGTALGERELGFYQQARYLAGLPSALVAPISGVVGLRTMSALRDDPRRQGRVFVLTQFAITRLLILFAVGAAIGGDFATRVILGPGWEPTGRLLQLFAPWLVIMPVAQNYKVMLIAIRRFPPIFWATGVSAAMMAACALPLALWLGTDGLVLGNLAAVIAYLWIKVAATPPHLAVGASTYVPTALAGAGAVGAGWAARVALGAALGGWWPAVVALAVGFTAFLALSWLLERGRLKVEVGYVRGFIRARRQPPESAEPPPTDAPGGQP